MSSVKIQSIQFVYLIIILPGVFSVTSLTYRQPLARYGLRESLEPLNDCRGFPPRLKNRRCVATVAGQGQREGAGSESNFAVSFPATAMSIRRRLRVNGRLRGSPKGPPHPNPAPWFEFPAKNR